ncbi:MAG: bactofilin family protein [Longimicrobiales bacterium]
MLGGRGTSEGRTAERSGPSGGSDSIITQHTKIDGNCETTGRLRIEGHITGNVRASSLMVAPRGRVDGDIFAASDASDADAFIIEGHVAGAVHVPRVEVRKDGRVDGGIDASEAVIHGKVSGGILARTRCALEPTSVVEGDVRARRLALQEGGVVNGTIKMGDRAAEPGSKGGRSAAREAAAEAKAESGGAKVEA